jgi:uncharacterized small protein (DUF1192 family)
VLIGSLNPADSTKASELYDHFLDRVLGGDKAHHSGPHFDNPTNSSESGQEAEFVFAWYAAATRGDSISVSTAMWEKAREWAWGDRPMVALRFYDSETIATCPTLDLAVVSLLSLTEMVDRIGQLTADIEAERAATKRLVQAMRRAA